MAWREFRASMLAGRAGTFVLYVLFRMLIGFVVGLLVGLLTLAIPVGAGTILGHLVPDGQLGPVLAIAALLLLVVLAMTGFGLARSAALLRFPGRLPGRGRGQGSCPAPRAGGSPADHNPGDRQRRPGPGCRDRCPYGQTDPRGRARRGFRGRPGLLLGAEPAGPI